MEERIQTTVGTSLSDAKKRYDTVEDAALARTRVAARTANRFVAEHP